jgi:hypothetical protein
MTTPVSVETYCSGRRHPALWYRLRAPLPQKHMCVHTSSDTRSCIPRPNRVRAATDGPKFFPLIESTSNIEILQLEWCGVGMMAD